MTAIIRLTRVDSADTRDGAAEIVRARNTDVDSIIPVETTTLLEVHSRETDLRTVAS